MAKIQRLFDHLFNPVIPVFLALIGSFIFVDAYGPADVVNYHLPFSVRLFGLSNYPDFTGYMDDLYNGFPVLWRLALAPGLAMDRPRLFLVPNLFALGLFTFLCRRYLRLPLAVAAASCLVFPVALYEFRTALQDFFLNAMVGSAMLLLLYPRRAGPFSSVTRLLLPRELFGLLLLAIAANIKFQGFFMAFMLLVTWVFLRCREGRRLNSDMAFAAERSKSSGQVLIAVCLCLAIAFQPIHNIYKFGNPFFPIQVAGLRGSVPKTNSPIQYIPNIPFVFNTISFFASSTEIDPIIRSEAGWEFQRSWHNFNRPKPYYLDRNANHPWVMTGGSNGIIFVLLSLGAWLTLFQGKKMFTSFADQEIYSLHCRLIGVSLLFTLLPQSMELRYYMVILFMVAVVATSSLLLVVKSSMRWIVSAGLWFIIGVAFLSPSYFWFRTGQWSSDRGLVTPYVLNAVKPRIDCAAVIRHTESGGRAISFGYRTIPEQLKCFIIERNSN
jgi:hypothetical protein